MSTSPSSPILTKTESLELNQFLDSDQPASVIFTEVQPADYEGFFHRLDLFCKGFSFSKRLHNKVKPLLGRALLIIQKNPGLYRSKNYPTFEHFLTLWVEQKFDISRSEAYNAMKIARVFPNATPEQFAAAGISRLSALAHVASPNSVDGNQDLIEMAPTMTYREIVQWVTEKTHLQPGELKNATVAILTTKELAERWRTLSSDGKIHSMIGGTTAGAVFAVMMDLLEQAVSEAESEAMNTIHQGYLGEPE